MALPVDLNTVTVTGTFKDATGVPQAGTVSFTPNAVLTDATGSTVIPVSARTYTLSGGSFTTDALAATDNSGISPPGWAYVITVSLANLQPWSFTAAIPHSPSTVDISALTPLYPVPATQAYLPAGGGTLTGTLVLNGSPALQVPSGAGAGQVLTSDASGNAAWAAGETKLGYYYLDNYTGTDDAKMTSALAAAFAASPAGGTIVLSPRAHSFASQWATAYSAGVATAVKIRGAGAAFNGNFGTATGATTATFTYSGGGAAMMDFQHIGTIELTGIQFKQANTGIPFALVTNATPEIHGCVFSGGGTGTGCVTDAILLGGGGNSVGAGDTAKYNGYQGRIYGNFFDGTRRAVYLQHGANSVEVFQNTISTSCGSPSYLGAPFELADTTGGGHSLQGAHIWGNCIEITSYQVGIKATTALSCTFGPNGFFDNSGSFVACHWLDPTTAGCRVFDGYRSNSVQLLLDLSNTTTVMSNQADGTNITPATVGTTYRGGTFRVFSGTGIVNADSQGDLGGLTVSQNVNPYPIVNVIATPGTVVSDGITYSGSQNIVSATAAFVPSDIGEAIKATGLATFQFIQWVYSATTAPAWQASAAYSLGDVTRPASANAHLYQCTTAGTSGSSAPAFPTGGGTVTDGTAVWTDMGSSTCAVTAPAATATGTGVTLNFGRLGSSLVMTGFNRHHVVSTGSVPAWAIGAGAGTSGNGATVTVATGSSDLSQEITVLTASTGTAAGTLATGAPNINFNFRAPKVWITAKNSATATLMAGGVYIAATASSWTLSCVGTPATSTSYVFDILSME